MTIGKISTIDASHTTLIGTSERSCSGSGGYARPRLGSVPPSASRRHGRRTAATTPGRRLCGNDSILGFTLSATTSDDGSHRAVERRSTRAIASVTSAGATLGATKTRIDSQSTFVSSLSDAITSGVGSLVDADMNVASTRLQALQTQQQLGIQSLSIANQNSQLILKLFGS